MRATGPRVSQAAGSGRVSARRREGPGSGPRAAPGWLSAGTGAERRLRVSSKPGMGPETGRARWAVGAGASPGASPVAARCGAAERRSPGVWAIGARVSGPRLPRRLAWAPTLRRSGKLPELETGKLPESCGATKVPELAALKPEVIG